MKKLISLVLTIALCITSISFDVKATDYSQYSNQSVGFGLGLRTDHKVPTPNKPYGVSLKISPVMKLK